MVNLINPFGFPSPVDTLLKSKKKKKKTQNPTPTDGGVTSSVSIPKNVTRISPEAQAEQDKRNKAGLKPQTYNYRGTQVSKNEFNVLTGKGGFETPTTNDLFSQQPGTRQYQEAQAKKAQQAINTATNLTPEQQVQLQQQANQNVGPEGIIPGNINLGEAATAGLADVTTGLAVAAPAAGVAAATGAGAPVAAGALALGALGGFIKGAYSNIKAQQGGLVKAGSQNVEKALSNMNMIISGVNMGLDPTEASLLYNQQLASTYEAYSELKLQTQGNAGAFDDGTKELEKFQIFFQPGGTLDALNARFAQAVANPNPNKIDSGTLQQYIDSQS